MEGSHTVDQHNVEAAMVMKETFVTATTDATREKIIKVFEA